MINPTTYPSKKGGVLQRRTDMPVKTVEQPSAQLMAARKVHLNSAQLQHDATYQAFGTTHDGVWCIVVSKFQDGNRNRIGDFEADNDASIQEAVELFAEAFQAEAGKLHLTLHDLKVVDRQARSATCFTPCFLLRFKLTSASLNGRSGD